MLTVDELLEAVAGWPFGRSGTYEAMRRGEVPSVRIGRRLFIPTAPLRQMLGLGDLVHERDEGRVAVPGLREDSHRLAARGGRHGDDTS